jgi:hypothetical protein
MSTAVRGLIETLHRVWSTGDVSMVPAVCAPDFVAHLTDGWGFSGHDGVCRAVQTVRGGFPDWTETIEDVIIEGDRAVTRYVNTKVNRHPGAGRGPLFKFLAG